jgi:hypothetical protein
VVVGGLDAQTEVVQEGRLGLPGIALLEQDEGVAGS